MPASTPPSPPSETVSAPPAKSPRSPSSPSCESSSSSPTHSSATTAPTPHPETIKTVAWLARLVTATGFTIQPFCPAFTLADIKLDSAAEATHQAMALLRQTAAQMAALADIRWFPCYGDFKPENLILSSAGRIYGIDSQMNEIGPEVSDAAYFLNHAALLRIANVGGWDAAA